MSETLVTSSASTGAGTLAEVVADAADGDVVRFSETVFSRGERIEIALAAPLEIDKNLTLDGGPFRVRLTAPSAGRVAKISDGARVVFSGFDFVGGVADGASDATGGGVLVDVHSSLTLTRCRVVGCDASQNGGGVCVGVGASCELVDSAIYGNRATLDGGGVYVSEDATLVLRGSTVVANACGVDGADVFAADDFCAATASNSIVEVAARADSDELFEAENDAGNVVGVARADVGFVEAPEVDAFYESWTATAWENWDFHLLDDAAANPSAYRDAGTFEGSDLSRYDLDGNFRGRTATSGVETVASRSPGCFETIQADFFWIGKDSTGQVVASPSFANADGWATSRFADVCGSTVPAWSDAIFIGSSATFIGLTAPSLFRPKNIVVSGYVSVSANDSVLGDLTFGVGAYFGKTIYPRNVRFGDESEIFGVSVRFFEPVVFCGLNASVAYQGVNIYSPIRELETTTLTLTPSYGQINLAGEYRADVTIIIARHVYRAVATEPVEFRARTFTYSSENLVDPFLSSDSAPVKIVLTKTSSFFRDYATSGVRADEVVVDLSETGSTTLTLDGQRVCGACSGAVSATGSARVDDSLLASALTLEADASLALEGGTVRTTTLTTAAGTAISGTGYLQLAASGSWTDGGATLGGVSGANYDATDNLLKIEVFDPNFEPPISKIADANVCLTTKSFDSGTPTILFEKYRPGVGDAPGSYATLYDSSTPVVDSTAAVYEASVDWNGTSKKTLVDASAADGWNFYRVSPKGPLTKGNATLNFNESETRRVAIWKGETEGESEPAPTYFYRGGATGSFADASDWALSVDGVAEFDGTPTFAGSVVDFPTSASVGDFPTDAAPSRIDVEFPSEIEIFDASGRRIDGTSLLVSIGVPAPTGLEIYVGNGGTLAFWTPIIGATRYEMESVETSPQTFESVDASWRDELQKTEKSWRVRVAAPIYGDVESWSNVALATRPLTSVAEKETESSSIGSRSFVVVYAPGFPGEGTASVKRRRVDSASDDWETVDSEWNETEFSDLPPTFDEYVYRVEWNRAPNVWVETTTARWDVGLFSWIGETTFPTSAKLASETPTFAARIERKKSGELLRREEVAAIRFSLFEKRTIGWKSFERLAVGGRGEPFFEDVPIAPATLRNSLLTDAVVWTRDAVGANFVFTPNASGRRFFPSPGEYVVRVAFDVLPLGESPSKKRTFFVDFDVVANGAGDR